MGRPWTFDLVRKETADVAAPYRRAFFSRSTAIHFIFRTSGRDAKFSLHHRLFCLKFA